MKKNILEVPITNFFWIINDEQTTTNSMAWASKRIDSPRDKLVIIKILFIPLKLWSWIPGL